MICPLMSRPERKIEIGKEYYIGRSKGWDWFGTKRWWDYYVILDGWNGSGGYWLRQLSGWNGGKKDHFTEIKTLSYEESRELDKKILANWNAEKKQCG